MFLTGSNLPVNAAQRRATVDQPSFIFACCQNGTETALKTEVVRNNPEFRFSFSRPGFVTFKVSGQRLSAGFDLRSVFARTYGISTGRITGQNISAMADDFWKTADAENIRHLHVWQRDQWLPGERGFEPGVSPLAEQVGIEILERRPRPTHLERRIKLNQRARAGGKVLDVVIVEPNDWWCGYHHSDSVTHCWPGGVIEFDVPVDIASRAFLKTAEALRWSRFPVARGDSCVEIGSAPGGSAQALLERGLLVTGIDPAPMDKEVAAHPHFTHIQKRGADLKRNAFCGFKWLTADVNVAPSYTLQMVEDIVSCEGVNIRGMLLTLKMIQPELIEEIPTCVKRIRSWGFEYVRVRQLAHNRNEVCVAALRTRSMRRKPKSKKKPNSNSAESTPKK